MAIVFKKSRNRGSNVGGQQMPLRVSAFLSRERKDCQVRRPGILVRFSAALLRESGWLLGDRCVVSVDGRTWTIERTTNQETGFRITKGGAQKGGNPGYVKFNASPEQVSEVGLSFGVARELIVTKAGPDCICGEMKAGE